MLDKLDSTDFSPYLDQSFRLWLEGVGLLEFELIEVQEMSDSTDEVQGHRRPFSIVFRGPEQPVLPQRIYRIEHPSMGTLDLFLVPLGPGRSGGIHYEAVFT